MKGAKAKNIKDGRTELNRKEYRAHRIKEPFDCVMENEE